MYGAIVTRISGAGLDVVGMPAADVSRIAAKGGFPLDERSTHAGSLEDTFLGVIGEAGAARGGGIDAGTTGEEGRDSRVRDARGRTRRDHQAARHPRHPGVAAAVRRGQHPHRGLRRQVRKERAGPTTRAHAPTSPPSRPNSTAFSTAKLALIVFGVLVVTGEHTSGMMRVSLLAAPRRGRLYAAKMSVTALAACLARTGARACASALHPRSRLRPGHRPRLPGHAGGTRVPRLLAGRERRPARAGRSRRLITADATRAAPTRRTAWTRAGVARLAARLLLAVQRRDLRTPRHQHAHGENPRRQPPGQAARPAPRAVGHHRLRGRPGRARHAGLTAVRACPGSQRSRAGRRRPGLASPASAYP
ncbi:hypothetical protein QFZ22_003136 [Streptomyces canus]|uniref:ABC transporter ATP-binding protein n=1 Tax=Streptomyces canus TaxID=58343 RepID=A0AAW8FD15_9ACTN|nr:hypothetical protein [Streptomyces canus]